MNSPTKQLIDLCREVEELERECIDIAKSGDTEGWIEAGKKYGPKAIQLAKHSCRLLPPLIEALEEALECDCSGRVVEMMESALALAAKELEAKEGNMPKESP